MRPGPIVAFAPGRANLIGEHTDYNDGLSLPFAIAEGVRATAEPRPGDHVVVRAVDHDEDQRFALAGGPGERRGDWRDFVRGAIGELAAAGVALRGGDIALAGTVPEGSGLSSSAALEVALSLALLALAGEPEPTDRVALARLCSRIENDWVGAHTGLLDQLASLLGTAGHALRIDFRTLETRPVPLVLDGWRLVVVDSGERHSHAASKYNERRAECERARDLLGLESLRDARVEDLERLPDPLDRRVRHAIEENARVDVAVGALEAGEVAALGPLLDASHASLRDLYDASTDAVERTVEHLRAAGATGARMMGGGFGGQVIALLAPGTRSPAGARDVTPSAGARVCSNAQLARGGDLYGTDHRRRRP
ncbi:MAG: galactokinase [Solirubrobacterales bacterium]|nr:galactokinase [Solirubrobacterales bacterium]